MAKKFILSIDGGGVRGIVPALVLQDITVRLSAKGKTKPLYSYFDVIIGTSAGGIIAAALTAPDSIDRERPLLTPTQICEFFENHVSGIFPQSLFQKIRNMLSFIDEKYSQSYLEQILEDVFGERRISEALTKIVLTAYDIETRSPVFISNIAGVAGGRKDFLLRDAVRATTAAPTYFEPARIQNLTDGAFHALIDGGVFMNDPSLSAIYFAKILDFELDDLVILSLGTGSEARSLPYHEVKNWGIYNWVHPRRGVPILSILMSGQSVASKIMLEKTFNKTSCPQRYIKIDAPLSPGNDDLDDSSDENLRELAIFARKLIQEFDRELEEITDLL